MKPNSAISNLVIRLKHLAMRADLRRKESVTTEESTTPDLAPVTLSTHYWEEDEDVAFVSQGFSDDNNRYIGIEQGVEKALELALLVYKRSGQFSIFSQIGMQGSNCGITIYNAEPKNAQLINDTIRKMHCLEHGQEWGIDGRSRETCTLQNYV